MLCNVNITLHHFVVVAPAHSLQQNNASLSDFKKFGQVWTSLDEFGRVWTGLDKFGQVWTSLDELGQGLQALKLQGYLHPPNIVKLVSTKYCKN